VHHRPDGAGLERADPGSAGYAGIVLAWGFLEWFFTFVLVGLVGVVGLVFLYLVAQLFMNPGRRGERPR
jgi:hypothetical protein